MHSEWYGQYRNAMCLEVAAMLLSKKCAIYFETPAEIESQIALEARYPTFDGADIYSAESLLIRSIKT